MGDVKIGEIEKQIRFGSEYGATVTFRAKIRGERDHSAYVSVRTAQSFLGGGRDAEVEVGQASCGQTDPAIALVRAKLAEKAALTAAGVKRHLDNGDDIFAALDTTEAEVIEKKGVLVESLPHLREAILAAVGEIA